MMLKKFNEYCDKIICECNTSLFDKKLHENHWFAPKESFKITEDMLIDDGYPFKDLGSWAGKVKEILSDDEIIYEVWGKYFEREENVNLDINNSLLANISNFCRIRCKPFLIKYKLTPGNSYYICDKVDPNCKWLEVVFNRSELENDIETEDGECCGGDASITTNSVFGSGNTADDSLLNTEKDPNGPGITTADIKAMYTLSLNPKTKKPKRDYPVFKRTKI